MSLYDRDYMRERPQRKHSLWPQWLTGWTPLHWIILINVAVFCLQHLGADIAVDRDGDNIRPLGGVSITALAQGEVWTLITYMFVHQNLLHLGVNLLGIWYFGQRVQALLGARSFVLIYVLAGLVGAALQMATSAYLKGQPSVPIIGASGCASGLMLAFATLLPAEPMAVAIYFIIPLNVTARALALGFVTIELCLGILSLIWPASLQLTGMKLGETAYFAHLGGALLGWYYIKLMGYGQSPMTYEKLWRDKIQQRPNKPREVARVRHQRAMPEMDEMAVRRQHQAPGGRALPMMSDVDDILEKISTQGLSSLTEEERKLLDHASREIAKRDAKKKA
jgi:membrane associated rhomboid family serine protease